MSSTSPSCHGNPGGALAPAGAAIIAMVDAPNSGKSTLFNALTGAKVQTGNWPGTSVEVSRGAWNIAHSCCLAEVADLIDFPGTYSLDPLSPDEALTRAMLYDAAPAERPDHVIVVVDATAVARGLNLAFQLAELPYRLSIALTKLDVAQDQGLRVDADALARATGIPVVCVDGRRREGLERLRETVQVSLTEEP